MPEWLKIGARPIRWAFCADSEEIVRKFAERHDLQWDKLEVWNGKWWLGGQGNHGVEFK